MKKLFLFLIGSLSFNNVFADVALVSHAGEVTLLSSRGNDILIQRCEDHTVLKTQSDCRLKTVNSFRWATVDEFSDDVKKSLNLIGDYDDKMRETVRHYLGIREEEAELETEQRQIEHAIKRIREYIDAYGDSNTNMQSLKDLQTSQTQIRTRIEHMKIVRQAEGIVNTLINQAKDSVSLKVFVVNPKNPSFEYNILRNYIKRVRLDFNFIKIERGEYEVSVKDSAPEALTQLKAVDSFEIQQYEVTQAQYFAVMYRNPSVHKDRENCPEDYLVVEGVGLCPNHPVEGMSWNDATAFAQQLSKLLNASYRLPTEAEWQVAAQGKVKGKFFFGNDEKFADEYAWFLTNSNKQTHAVGLKKSNPFGLFDVYGNVREWTNDNSQSSYDYPYVMGGSVLKDSGAFTGSDRSSHYRQGFSDLGIRLVRELKKAN